MKRMATVLLTLVFLVSVCGVGVADEAFSPDAVVSLLKDKLQDTEMIKFDFSYADDGSLYYMYVNMDNIAALVTLARQTEEYKARWDTLTENMRQINVIAGNFLQLYYPGQTLSIATFVRSDTSEDQVLYAALNGEVVYDPVNEINLLGLE